MGGSERPLTLGLTLLLLSGGQRLRLTESDKLQVQIQAYLDNVFDVGALLEDTETKNAVLEHMEELQEQVAQVGGVPELGPAHRRPPGLHSRIRPWASNPNRGWAGGGPWLSAWFQTLT